MRTNPLSLLLAGLTLTSSLAVAQAPEESPDAAASPDADVEVTPEGVAVEVPPARESVEEAAVEEAAVEEAAVEEAAVEEAPATPEPPAASEEPTSGPMIEMPPEAEQEESSAGEAPPVDQGPVDPTFMRGMQQDRFRRAAVTPMGGYGELHFNLEMPEVGANETQLDLHRLVLFVAHNFSNEFRFYLEFEVEHALVTGGNGPGQVGIEQAFVDWQLLGDALTIRAGIVLVPMGIINQWHEPPIFHGVERPMVDKVIIPSTWREGGIGIVGQPVEGLRYELYVTGGLNALGFSGRKGIRGGRQGVAEALAGSPAVTGRLEYEPMLGLIVGASGFFNLAGQSAHIEPDVPVVGASADARLNWRGIEARGLFAYFSIGDTDELRAMTDDAGNNLGLDVGSGIMGAYVEAGYNVLNLMDTDHALVPFARFEWWDTTFDEQEAAYDLAAITSGVFGLTYRPMPQLAFKFDYTIRRPSSGTGEDIVNLGVGWMF